MAARKTGRREIVLSTDGASRGNPGPSGAGILITSSDGTPLVQKAVFLGSGTNNQAEYRALLIGLEELQKLPPARVTIRMDSELIVRQLNGQYRVRSPDLTPLYRRALDLIKMLGEVHIQHIPREKNKTADRLANRAIDENEDRSSRQVDLR